MPETMTVGDMVAEFLAACGVTTVFGVIAVHNIPTVDAIGRRNGIRFVMTRGETGAAHMADGYSRIGGRLGVVMSSTGGGAANAVHGLMEALLAGSPVLHITGQTATPHLDRAHGTSADFPNQLAMLQSVSKSAYRVRSPQAALGILIRAATEALTPPMGPVSVEIPVDIQRAVIERPLLLDHLELPVVPVSGPSERQLDALADIVMSARRPMLWLGNGAREAGPAARRLLDLGFCAVSSYNGRGIVSDEDTRTLGALSGRHTPLVEEFYRSVDLMVIAGSRVRGYETRDLSLRLPDRRVQIDLDPLANGRTYSSDYFVAADAAATLDALADRIAGRIKVDAGFQQEFAELKKRVQVEFRQSLGVYADFPETLRAAMPRDAIWVRDVTASGATWGSRLLPIYGPRDNLFARDGAIGVALPLAVGASLAGAGRKVVAMCGDGGFALSLNELWTAVQEKTDILFLVMNDRGYAVIKEMQDLLYDGRRRFSDLMAPEPEGLARLAGMPFRRVADPEDFGPGLSEIMGQPGPAILEVDLTAIGPVPPHWEAPPYAGGSRVRH